jgi:hypothetical protein
MNNTSGCRSTPGKESKLFKLSDFTGQWPSLLQGSAQRVKITKFKTNPMDLTIGMHILTVRANHYWHLTR